jgi:hypothetical protein
MPVGCSSLKNEVYTRFYQRRQGLMIAPCNYRTNNKSNTTSGFELYLAALEVFLID